MSELALLTVEVLVASIAILALVAALLYFVFSEVRASRAELRGRLTNIETRFQQWAPALSGIPEMLERQGDNPNGRRQELVTKWKLGTLTYDGSVELRDILASEAAQADAAMKNILSLALLALFIYALSKSIK